MKIKLITDSACDLPLHYIKENKIEVASLEVNIKGEFVKDDLGENLTFDYFYNLLREGEKTSTSQVNIHTFEELFRKYTEEGYAIIYIGLASALSGTVNSARAARENIMAEYVGADITVIDSKSASLGEGSLVHEACEKIKAGMSKEEVVTWVRENRNYVHHAITVDDLGFLKRGGRISGTVATVGSLLHIKPTVGLDKEGKVIPTGKIKGSKNALRYLVQEVKEKGVDLENQVIFIAHGGCLEKAETLRQMLLEEVGEQQIIISCIGAVIGTHGGPGAMAVMFRGNKRL